MSFDDMDFRTFQSRGVVKTDRNMVGGKLVFKYDAELSCYGKQVMIQEGLATYEEADAIAQAKAKELNDKLLVVINETMAQYPDAK